MNGRRTIYRRSVASAACLAALGAILAGHEALAQQDGTMSEDARDRRRLPAEGRSDEERFVESERERRDRRNRLDDAIRQRRFGGQAQRVDDRDRAADFDRRDRPRVDRRRAADFDPRDEREADMRPAARDRQRASRRREQLERDFEAGLRDRVVDRDRAAYGERVGDRETVDRDRVDQRIERPARSWYGDEGIADRVAGQGSADLDDDPGYRPPDRRTNRYSRMGYDEDFDVRLLDDFDPDYDLPGDPLVERYERPARVHSYDDRDAIERRAPLRRLGVGPLRPSAIRPYSDRDYRRFEDRITAPARESAGGAAGGPSRYLRPRTEARTAD